MITASVAATAVSSPRKPALSRDIAMQLAADEYDRFVAQLRQLTPDDWSTPTACPAWDVHAMACHVLGMAELAASVPEQLRQMRAARKTGGLFIDALTALQVDKHITRSPAAVVARLAEVGPRAAAGRRRTPALVRRIAACGPTGRGDWRTDGEVDPWLPDRRDPHSRHLDAPQRHRGCHRTKR